MTRVSRWLFTCCAGVLWFTSFGADTPVAAESAVVYPLKMSANRRYLVDQNNTPVLIAGDSPHAMIPTLTLGAADTFLTSRQAAGFNTMWVQMFCSPYSDICSGYSSYDGIAPFRWTPGNPLSFDISAPNEAYFAKVDSMVNLAAAHNIVLFLGPTETGGWMDIYRVNGAAKAFNFGVYLGNRYKAFPNIVWQHGGDFQTYKTASDDEIIRSVARGIASVDTNHIQTVELDFPTSGSLDDPTGAPLIHLSSAYSYYSPYDQMLKEYNRSAFIPVYFNEGVYEYQGYMGGYLGPQSLRAQEYWTQLSGSTGQLYGNALLYSFPANWQTTNWAATPGIKDFTNWINFFKARAWYDLIPDQNHSVVTAGYGTYQPITLPILSNVSDYVTTARMSDGSAAISYIPTTRTVTVEMSQISGPVAARWFDPANGAYIGIQGPLPNSGSRQFSTPGINAGGDTDWLLVLEATQDVTPPALSNIQFSSVGLAGGTIGWTSNEDSTSKVEYGTTAGYGSAVSDSTLTRTHSMTVPGLVSHTVYHFRVSSTDASGNVSAGPDRVFTTLSARRR